MVSNVYFSCIVQDSQYDNMDISMDIGDIVHGSAAPHHSQEDCSGACNNLGAVSIRKTVLPGMAIPMLKIRRPNGRLIFNMEIAIRR